MEERHVVLMVSILALVMVMSISQCEIQSQKMRKSCIQNATSDLQVVACSGLQSTTLILNDGVK